MRTTGEFGNCVVVVIAKFVGTLSGVAAMKKSLLQSVPPWGLVVMGMRVRVGMSKC